MNLAVRFCRVDEIRDVMQFLDNHWARGHILSFHRSLMDWQHRERDGRGYSFVIARNGDDGPVLGILGFISTRHYDPDLRDVNVVDLAIWKIHENAQMAGLGLKLHHFLMENEPHVAAISIGIGTRAHDSMYRALGYFTGDFCQHYLVNPTQRRFTLAHFPDGPPLIRAICGEATLEPVTRGSILVATADLEIGARANVYPLKTATYFRERFLSHPVYRYDVHVVRHRGAARGLLASRIATHNGARALRIVDFLGVPELFAEMGIAITALVRDSAAEYADLWSWGIPNDVLATAGFIHRAESDSIIIPNYFEPFERSNGHIFFAAKPTCGSFVLFRADGDQDRPNLANRD